MSQTKAKPAAKPAAKKTAKPKPPPKLSKFERFDMQEVDRGELVKAPYNPRKIKSDNKQRLRERIERVGMLAPIVWNKQTGNIVSGHQRLEVLDTLSRSKNYKLTVAVVDLDPATEKEQNMFFNNTSSQGEWDLDKLGDLWDDDINMALAGFSKIDMEALFDADPADVFAESLEANEVPLEAPPRAAAKAPKDQTDDDGNVHEEANPDDKYFEQGDKVREGMRHRKRRAAVAGLREDVDFFFVAVFRTQQERDSFLADYGVEEAQFINGNVLREAINGS